MLTKVGVTASVFVRNSADDRSAGPNPAGLEAVCDAGFRMTRSNLRAVASCQTAKMASVRASSESVTTGIKFVTAWSSDTSAGASNATRGELGQTSMVCDQT